MPSHEFKDDVSTTKISLTCVAFLPEEKDVESPSRARSVDHLPREIDEINELTKEYVRNDRVHCCCLQDGMDGEFLCLQRAFCMSFFISLQCKESEYTSRYRATPQRKEFARESESILLVILNLI